MIKLIGNHETTLSQLQKICRTKEERNTSTTVHGASLSFQACYDAIIKNIQGSLDDHLIKYPTSQLTMKDSLEEVLLIGVLKGSVHNSLSNKNNEIVTYSIGSHSADLFNHILDNNVTRD